MLALLAFLPAAWVLAESRLASFVLFVAYYAIFSRDIPIAYARFFPGEWLGVGYVSWLLHASCLSLPWAIFWKKEWNAKTIAIRLAIVLTVTLLPPVGLFNWGHPMLAAGALFPELKTLGLALCALFGYSIALWAIGDARGMKGTKFLVIFAVLCNFPGFKPYVQPSPPVGWQAINTNMGQHPSSDFNRGFTWQQELIRKTDLAIDSGAKVVVLPEEIAGEWKPSHNIWWRSTEEKARKNGSIVLLGADLRPEKDFFDAVLLLGEEQEKSVALTARVPMPVGNWRFWSSEKSAVTDIFGSGVRMIAGKKTAFSLCYEDFLIWPQIQWMSMLDKPDVLVSMVNDWSVSGLTAQWHQTLSIESQARLGGVPLVRARNL